MAEPGRRGGGPRLHLLEPQPLRPRRPGRRGQEGADLLFATAPATTDDRADRLFREAEAHLTTPAATEWRRWQAAGLGTTGHPRPKVDWRDDAVTAFFAKQQQGLALLRKAAALPASHRGGPPSLHDPYAWTTDRELSMRRGDQLALLSIDARVMAAAGDLPRDLDDLAALLGYTCHLPGMLSGPDAMWPQFVTWWTLEDVLRLVPAGKPIPVSTIPEVISPFRVLHREMAVIAMIYPALLADDPLRSLSFASFSAPSAIPPCPGGPRRWPPPRRGLPYARRTDLLAQEVGGLPPPFKALVRGRRATGRRPGPGPHRAGRPVQRPVRQAQGEEATARRRPPRGPGADGPRRFGRGALPRQARPLPRPARATGPGLPPGDADRPANGQGLRIKQSAAVTVLHTAGDTRDLETMNREAEDGHRGEPIFRLYPRPAAKK